MSVRIWGLKRVVTAGCVLCLLTFASEAQAQSRRQYQVGQGPLSAALMQFARQTDQEVLFNNELLVGRRTSGFTGVATAADALERLLASSGLTFTQSASGALLIVKLPEPVARPPAPVVRRPARGDAAAPAATETVSTVEELVVTGSLVVRDGYQAPTPVTIVDIAELQEPAPSNIPDGLNLMPQFAGSRSQTQNPQTSTAINPAAGNYLNLRNLGIVRSLILLDGLRLPPTSYEGTVDVNVLPQALMQRVDIVTAGASATYGSDALTGVVNFVLDKRFTGLKGSVQGGVSERGDDNSYRVTLAGGAPVLRDRGRVLFSLEHYQSDGVRDKSSRPFYDLQPIAFGNGSTIPYRTAFNARTSNATDGGLILSGPLANQKFGLDGSLSPFDQGSVPPLGGVQLGGDGGLALHGSLVGSLRTEQAFARFAYDFTDTVSGFVQAAYGEARNRYAHNGADNRLGNLTIFSGNAFLRPEVQAALTASNTASFSLGRQGFEQGPKVVDILNDSTSLFAGLEGRLGGDWSWRLNYTYGAAIMRAEHSRNPENSRYFAAIDAVRDPASGAVVCRVTLTNPGLYPGCTPLDILGANRASPEALAYVFGQDSQYRVTNTLHDAAFHVAGSLLDLPAGPVSIAAGAEYRAQSLHQTTNADPSSPVDTTGLRGFPAGQGRFGNTNQGVADGSLDVGEAFGEVVAPLLKDMRFARSLELNGAVRVTDYSTSGRVETWKAGFSYLPISDLRVRATVSRDIRAPTLNELYAGAQLNAVAFNDIHTGQTVTITTIRSGSTALTPEIGHTQTVGLVYRPSWLSGFSASADYYDVYIEGAIATNTPQQINQDCEDSNGLGPACAFVFRPLPFSDRSAANTLQRVQLAPLNLSQTYTHGIDIEATYRLALSEIRDDAPGVLSLRLLANYAPSYKTRDTPTTPVQQRAGLGGDLNNPGGNPNNPGGNPKWRAVLSANYIQGPLSLTLQERYIGRMVRSNQPSIVYEDNVLKPVRYTTLSATWRFKAGERNLEAFATINNLWDRAPPIVPYTTEPGLRYPTLQGLYDVVGRYYTAGLRFRL